MPRGHRLLKALPGFEQVNRYWDLHHRMVAAKLLPGEYYVTGRNELITTVLGSCVAACIRDPYTGVGGMNHFMLPRSEHGGWGDGTPASTANRYGNYAMEHMINDILGQGGRRSTLEIKIFGGGQIIPGMTGVGQSNIDFVRDYLATEGLAVAGADLGGIFPRKLIYFPSTGRVLMRKLKTLHNSTILRREQLYEQELRQHPLEGAIELFDQETWA